MSTATIACRHNRSFLLDPARTALLAIDMQRDFLTGEDGKPNAMARIVPAFARLTALLRQAGCRIIHTRESYAPDLSDVNPRKVEEGYPGRPGPMGRYLIRGEPGCDFAEELAPAAGEEVIEKPGFGAFWCSDLDRRLARAGISHLVLAGVTTQCCVHSTLREAVDRGYWCLTVADCCAAPRPEWHEAALELIASEDHLFGSICDLADLQRGLGGDS